MFLPLCSQERKNGKAAMTLITSRRPSNETNEIYFGADFRGLACRGRIRFRAGTFLAGENRNS
jgi:hypothetical protein